MNPAYGELIDDRSPRGIAAAIARLITAGVLAPGDRLPTVRELGAELGVSPATVSQAWQAMAGVGLIVSRGRSGSFVRSAPQRPSSTFMLAVPFSSRGPPWAASHPSYERLFADPTPPCRLP